MSVNLEDFQYIASFFEPPLTPRRYSTQATNDGQYVAETLDDLLKKFEESDYIDCRVNAYNYLGKYRKFEAPSVIIHSQSNSNFQGHSLQTDLSYAHTDVDGHASYHYDIAASLYNPESAMSVTQRIEKAAKLIQIKALAEQAPKIIFIDLDDRKALQSTCRRIKDIFMDAELEPTVLDSGNGYNLLLKLETDPEKYPVPITDYDTKDDLIPGRTLESAKTFALAYDYNPANISPGSLFMRCASEILTRKKADRGNHPYVRSCMIRVPGSYNGKLKRKGIDKQVSIVERGSWEHGRKGHIMFLLPHLNWWLKEQREKRERSLAEARKRRINREELTSSSNNDGYSGNNSNNNNSIYYIGQKYYNPEIVQLHYWYIEVMLRTPLDDFRKQGTSLVIAPYLIRIKKMPYDIARTIILQWLAACDELQYLDFNAEERTISALDYARDMNYLPCELSKIEERNPAVHAKLLRLRESYYCNNNNNSNKQQRQQLPSPPPASLVGGN